MADAESLVAESGLCSRSRVTYPAAMGHVPEDSALMLRYRDGDIAAFELLYSRHSDALYRYLLRLCRNRDLAEDIFQEAWGKIVKSRASYRATAKFSTFLYRVARNCFVDQLRRDRRHAHAYELDEELHADGGALPESLAERALAKQRLSRALMDLPDEQRDAFLLYEEAGLSVDQIAVVMGSKRETAKSRIRYATKKLREAIDEPGGHE